MHLVLDECEGIKCLKNQNGNCFVQDAADFLLAEEDCGGMQTEVCEGNIISATLGEVQVGQVMEDEMGQYINMSGTFPRMKWNRGQNEMSWEAQFALRKGEKGVRLKITLDWHGEATRIRLRIPGCMPGRDVFYEVPFGGVRREAYKNLPTARGEWPAHRFTAIESGSKGIALLNKGVAGVEQEGNALTTTMIRAYGDCDLAWVKPSDASSQCGKSTFEFMLVPYMCSYKENNIVQLAQEFNQPVKAWNGRSSLDITAESYFVVDQANIVLSSIKNAWDESGDLIIRFYETEGRETTGQFYLKGLKEVYSSDVTEAQGVKLANAGSI